jgi:hypothetical protein
MAKGNGKLAAGLTVGAFVVLSSGAVGQFAWLCNEHARLLERVASVEVKVDDILAHLKDNPNVDRE